MNAGGVSLEVFEGFFCHSLEYNPYTESVSDMFEKIVFFKAQRRCLLQNLAENIGLSVYGKNNRKDKTKNTNALLRKK